MNLFFIFKERKQEKVPGSQSAAENVNRLRINRSLMIRLDSSGDWYKSFAAPVEEAAEKDQSTEEKK